jgi:hypothetical protein
MSKIALATAVVALTAAVPLTMGRAEAQSYLPPPGAAPPWGTTKTMTTTMETKPAPTPAAAPATQPPRISVESGTTTPIQGTATPIQGTTTPIQAVSLRSGPSSRLGLDLRQLPRARRQHGRRSASGAAARDHRAVSFFSTPAEAGARFSAI